VPERDTEQEFPTLVVITKFPVVVLGAGIAFASLRFA